MDRKKLLGCCVERMADNMIALAPKCYSVFNDDGREINKVKGLDLNNNTITHTDYEDVLDKGIVKSGVNRTIRFKDNQLQYVDTCKKSLTAFHVKMVVLPNQCCCPYINGLDANDYMVVKTGQDEDSVHPVQFLEKRVVRK